MNDLNDMNAMLKNAGENKPELPPQYQEAVENGLTRYHQIAAEREAFEQQTRELRTQIAGYKVALEANDARILELENRAQTLILQRDKAVADLAVYETLFRGWKVQMDEFVPPRKPLAGELDKDEWKNRLLAQSNNLNPYFIGNAISNTDRSTVSNIPLKMPEPERSS